MAAEDIAKLAVERSAKLLDEHYGCIDWVGDIDTERLYMVSSDNCILGQLFGDYHVGCRELGISFLSSDDYAFTAGASFTFTDAYNAWNEYLRGEDMPSNLETCTAETEQVHIVFRYIPDVTNRSGEIALVVMVTKDEAKAGGAVQALNHAGVKCRMTAETIT